MSIYETISQCRSCSSVALKKVFSLGDTYVSDYLDAPSGGIKAPLTLVLCLGCGLVQLEHTVERDAIYKKYWYRSGINDSMKQALRDVTKAAERTVRLLDNDVVVDIGANDGTLLETYSNPKLDKLGFEPAKNLIPDNALHNIIIPNYFNTHDYFDYMTKKAKVITAIAMFYDLPNPNAFLQGVKQTLAKDGIFIIQQNYLPDMLVNNAFDNIGHEHLEYYSMYTLESLLNRNGLETFDLEFNGVNGGSFRTYIQHKDGSRQVKPKVTEVARIDRYWKQVGPFTRFSKRVSNITYKLRYWVDLWKHVDKTIYVYGASNRGSTILQAADIDSHTIKAAADRNPDKIGKFIAGTGIPIVSEEEARKDADYFLVLPYSFMPEFIVREQQFLARGGKFIVPLPEPKIVDKDGERPL